MKKNAAITKMQTLIIVAAILIVAVVGGVAYYLSLPSEGVEEVRVGLMYPLSGALADFGRRWKLGHDMAVHEINSAGGIASLGGANLTLIYSDIQGDPTIAMSEAERLVVQENVHVLCGTFQTSSTLTSTEVAERYEIPYFASSATDKVTERNFEWTFRAGDTTKIWARNAVLFAGSLADVETVALVVENSEHGMTAAQVAKEELAKIGGLEIVVDESYDSTAIDLSPLVLKIKQAEPDIVLAASYLTDGLLIRRQMRENDVNVKAYISMEPAGYGTVDFINLGGEDAEYVFDSYAVYLDDKHPLVQSFAQKYQDFYDTSEVPDAFTAAGYSYTYWIAACLETAGSLKPEDIRDAIIETEVKLDPLGDVKIDPVTGQNQRSNAAIGQILDGTFVIVYPEELARQAPVYPMPTWDER